MTVYILFDLTHLSVQEWSHNQFLTAERKRGVLVFKYSHLVTVAVLSKQNKPLGTQSRLVV